MTDSQITVFGSFVVDLTGWGGHLPVPGETVFGEDFKMGPGGKGSNQAVAAHRAGGNVTFISKVGNDPFAKTALDFYAAEQMNSDFILTEGEKPTGVALICVDRQSGQNQILVVPGACTNFTEKDMELIKPVIERSRYLLLQFEINMDALEKAMDIANKNGVTVVLNPAPVRDIEPGLLKKAQIITPNEVEAGGLLGMDIRDEKDARTACDRFHAMGVEGVVITMGKHGVYASMHGQQAMVPAYSVKAVDTTGAGDAFNGAFVTALAQGKGLLEAVTYGNAAGALSVTQYGTAPAMPFKDAIAAFLAQQ